jgi:hypothetical protein
MKKLDLSRGLPAERDLLLTEAPVADVRESISMWIYDDQGRFGLPRFVIEAIGSTWMQRGIQANIAFPSGRVFNGGASVVAPTLSDAERATVFGAGPLTFRCVEPFRRWTMSYDGSPLATTIERQRGGDTTGDPTPVHIELDCTMAVPPWIQGEMNLHSKKLLDTDIEGLFMGGARYEQLFRATGTMTIADEATIEFSATGLRVHRVGVRNTGEFWGHCWQSAVFPSGKAFGYIAFPTRPDGAPSYNEGFVFDGETMHAAQVVDAPWMKSFDPRDDVSMVLETADGKVRVGGVSTSPTYHAAGTSPFGPWQAGQAEAPLGIPFHQGGARYEWDDEVTYGMVERSLP